jgi:putative membrane protein
MHGFLGTKADFWWDLTITSETIVFTCLFIGAYLGRKHRGTPHHNTMLLSTILVAGWFLMYLAQQYIVGVVGFGGPEMVKYMIYYPIIIFHSLVSTAALILTGVTVFNGFLSAEVVEGRRILKKNPMIHKRLGWVTLLSFVFSIVTAYTVYTMLFVIYNPERTPSYGIKSSIGALSGIGAFVLIGLLTLFWYLNKSRAKAQI